MLTSRVFAAAMCQAQALRDLQAGCEVMKLETPATWHDYVEKHTSVSTDILWLWPVTVGYFLSSAPQAGHGS